MVRIATDTASKERIVLTLTDVGGSATPDARFARALKCLLRVYGFRCEDYRYENDDADLDASDRLRR